MGMKKFENNVDLVILFYITDLQISPAVFYWPTIDVWHINIVQGMPPGVPKSYRAFADYYGNIFHFTL